MKKAVDLLGNHPCLLREINTYSMLQLKEVCISEGGN